MKTWTVLASLATLLYLAGFSLLAVPPTPTRAPARAGITAVASDSDGPASSSAWQRHRQMQPMNWRSYIVR